MRSLERGEIDGFRRNRSVNSRSSIGGSFIRATLWIWFPGTLNRLRANVAHFFELKELARSIYAQRSDCIHHALAHLLIDLFSRLTKLACRKTNRFADDDCNWHKV